MSLHQEIVQRTVDFLSGHIWTSTPPSTIQALSFDQLALLASIINPPQTPLDTAKRASKFWASRRAIARQVAEVIVTSPGSHSIRNKLFSDPSRAVLKVMYMHGDDAYEDTWRRHGLYSEEYSVSRIPAFLEHPNWENMKYSEQFIVSLRRMYPDSHWEAIQSRLFELRQAVAFNDVLYLAEDLEDAKLQSEVFASSIYLQGLQDGFSYALNKPFGKSRRHSVVGITHTIESYDDTSLLLNDEWESREHVWATRSEFHDHCAAYLRWFVTDKFTQFIVPDSSNSRLVEFRNYYIERVIRQGRSG